MRRENDRLVGESDASRDLMVWEMRSSMSAKLFKKGVFWRIVRRVWKEREREIQRLPKRSHA